MCLYKIHLNEVNFVFSPNSDPSLCDLVNTRDDSFTITELFKNNNTLLYWIIIQYNLGKKLKTYGIFIFVLILIVF